jgi:hypothetical protein
MRLIYPAVFLTLIGSATVFAAPMEYARNSFDKQKFIKELKPKLRQLCISLAVKAHDEVTAKEQEANIVCLKAGKLPDTALFQLMDGFVADCADVLVEKMKEQIDGRRDMDADLSAEEILRLFLKRYDVAYQEHCAGDQR